MIDSNRVQRAIGDSKVRRGAVERQMTKLTKENMTFKGLMGGHGGAHLRRLATCHSRTGTRMARSTRFEATL